MPAKDRRILYLRPVFQPRISQIRFKCIKKSVSAIQEKAVRSGKRKVIDRTKILKLTLKICLGWIQFAQDIV
jgi:hypothetical protein